MDGFGTQIDPRVPCAHEGLGNLVSDGTGGGDQDLFFKPMGFTEGGESFEQAIHGLPSIRLGRSFSIAQPNTSTHQQSLQEVAGRVVFYGVGSVLQSPEHRFR
jgi:hypothetical protein